MPSAPLRVYSDWTIAKMKSCYGNCYAYNVTFKQVANSEAPRDILTSDFDKEFVVMSAALLTRNVLRFKPRTETSHIHLREIPPDLTEPQVYIQWTGYMQQQVLSTRHGCRGGERVSERGGLSESHVHDPGKASGMLPVIEADEAISYCPVPPPP